MPHAATEVSDPQAPVRLSATLEARLVLFVQPLLVTLNQHLDGGPYEVVNLSEGGYATLQEEQLMLDEVPALQPDLVPKAAQRKKSLILTSRFRVSIGMCRVRY